LAQFDSSSRNEYLNPVRSKAQCVVKDIMKSNVITMFRGFRHGAGALH